MGCGRSWLADQEEQEQAKQLKDSVTGYDLLLIKSYLIDLQRENMSRAGHAAVDACLAKLRK